MQETNKILFLFLVLYAVILLVLNTYQTAWDFLPWQKLLQPLHVELLAQLLPMVT